MPSLTSSANRMENRDHMHEILVEFQNASVKCLKSCLPNGPGSLEDSTKATKGPKALIQLFRFKKQLQQQLKDMKIDLITRGILNEEIDSSFNVSLSAARDPLDKEMYSVSNQELALKRLQSFNALLTALEIVSTQHLFIEAVMRHSADNCKRILAVQMSNRQLEQQMINIRKKRMETHMRQQDLFRNLCFGKTNHKFHEINTFGTVRENLETISNEVVILQEVFQRFIMSVQLHWAENLHIRSLLLRVKDQPIM
ncbi:centromere protein H-like [Pyxicephalus adspersus]|uniref:centromere protein H-like n=1 Tax=Pyxicephalus adspersus TaxID=30357 RepID=UPI003B58D4E4